MLTLYFIVTVLLVVLDQLSKFAVLKWIKPVDTIALWEGVFHLTYCENRGAAFGILQNKFGLFFIITIAVVISVTLFLVKKKPQSRWLTLSLASLVGGALGNFLDRLCRGFVVDFLDFRLINFAIFNLADCFVVVGAFLLAYYILFLYKEPEKKEEMHDDSNK